MDLEFDYDREVSTVEKLEVIEEYLNQISNGASLAVKIDYVNDIIEH